MDIAEFLQLCAGNWFSQRTSYQLEQGKAENSKSDITIEILSQEHPEVLKICQNYQLDPSQTLGGKKASWNSSEDWGTTKNVGSTTIILVPDAASQSTGQLLCLGSKLPASLSWGRYILGNDEALTLIIEQGDTYSQERLWFASPNLRLRTSFFKYGGGFSTTAFYSEIRKVAPPKR